MSKRKQIDGIVVEYPEAYTLRESSSRKTSRSKRRGAKQDRSVAHDFLLSVLEKDHACRVDQTIELNRPARKKRGATAEEDATVTLSVPTQPNEQTVILVEEDGVYRWVFPQKVKRSRSRRSGRPAAKERGIVDVTFEIDLGGLVYLPANRRGFKDRMKSLAGKVKAHVVRIGEAVSPSNLTIKFLERNVDTCLLNLKVENGAVNADKWEQLTALDALDIPSRRSPKVLLLIHGTFSSTIGSYGGLTRIEAGQTFLEKATEAYDLILGFDHATLSVDPKKNALQLLDLLKRVFSSAKKPPVIDAIGYSRGGLVLRSLIEQVLPKATWKATFKRAIFVGATNAGTQLAEPENWYRLIDFYTNMAVASSRINRVVAGDALGSSIFSGMIRGLGAMAKYLASGTAGNAKMPGLTAMEPDGTFIQEINQTQPGQPGPQEIEYYAVTSDFDLEVAGNGQSPGLPKRFILSLGDSLVDRLIGNEANDLVVDTASMTSIDSHVEGFVKDVCAYGRNSQVYHTVYFVQPATAQAFYKWLKLPGTLKVEAGVASTRSRRSVEITSGEMTHYEPVSPVSDYIAEPEHQISTKQMKDRPRLKVSVYWDDITRAKGDVYAVGHYIGVMPQHAEKAVDHQVSNIPWRKSDEGLILTKLTRQGLLRGELGQIELYPWGDKTQRLAAICGMGFFDGDFSEQNVRLLYRNLARQIMALPKARKLCTVLIGSGVGALQPPQALRGQLSGYADALSASGGKTGQFDEVHIVEINKDKADLIHDCLLDMSRQDDLELEMVLDDEVQSLGTGFFSREHVLSLLVGAMLKTYGSSTAPKRKELLAAYLSQSGLKTVNKEEVERQLVSAWKKIADGQKKDGLTEKKLSQTINISLSTADNHAANEPTRISIRLRNYVYTIAALTSSSAIPEREVGVDVQIINELVDRMTDPEIADVIRHGKMLHRLLIPRDFEHIFTAKNKIVFEVDRNTAAIHWEMIVDPLRVELGPVGLHSQTSRQLRTTYSNMPSARSENVRRAFVIGNPDGSLPFAQDEAIAVTQILSEGGFEVDTFIGPSYAADSHLLDYPAATRIDVLEKLFDGKYDIVHYSGHGDYDELNPSKTGWVFENGLLTARELERLSDVPSLIFANACLSVRTSTSTLGMPAEEQERAQKLSKPFGEAGLLPSLADEVIKLGVQNYIGTAWEVYDEGAILFARQFYTQLLQDKSIGEAMLEARKVMARREQYEAMWAAYQHYGSPDYRLGK